MKRSETVTAILLMLLAAVLLPIMDACSKLLTDRYETAQIIWVRYVVHVAVMTPFMLRAYGRAAFRPPHFAGQVARGLLMVAMALFYIEALSLIPMATAISIVFIFPFLVTASAPFVLGERVGIWRRAAVLFGLSGALLVVRPGGVEAWGAVLAFGATLAYTAYILLTRKLSGTTPAPVMLYFIGLVGMVVVAVVQPFVWQPVLMRDVPVFIGIGLMAAIIHLCVILAYSKAEASLIAPFTYFQIVGNVILGLVLFDDFPDALTWVGIGVIVTSGLLIVWRERAGGR